MAFSTKVTKEGPIIELYSGPRRQTEEVGFLQSRPSVIDPKRKVERGATAQTRGLGKILSLQGAGPKLVRVDPRVGSLGPSGGYLDVSKNEGQGAKHGARQALSIT